MFNKAMTLLAVVSVLTTVSCKKQEENATYKLDKNNNIIAQDQQVNEVISTPKTAKKKSEDYSFLKLEETTFDFGDIKQGNKVEHIFKFTNTGNENLLIIKAQPSCGCTVPEWTKEPIKKGDSGQIKIVFDSSGKSGKQSKSIRLTTNTENGKEEITFSANITDVKPLPQIK